MDQIIIKDLEVFANHGVFPEEKKLGQKFIITATLCTDTRQAGFTDNLAASIHYGEVSQKIDQFIKTNTFDLIERVAEELASYLLVAVKGLEQVTLEVKKPWAPIGLPLAYAAVKITRGWHTAYLALGSNLGEKEEYIRGAVSKLGAKAGCQVLKVSELITTKPFGGVEQDDFLNGCLKLKTLLRPLELLRLLQDLESQADRQRTVRWGPRTLDLDILFYDNEIIGMDDLIIPHPGIPERDFVLQPLAEIAPNLYHPILGKTITQLRRELHD